ncbi:MAG TPA: rod-binding protein [Deltaproteobacteria bacterium]|nr:rod-binding protein [Deltaproteobacteria bacterium]HOM29282.1 rod-binding protein [Deltaproteobacteria bacterium]HPP80856.1 rod-binding protein [Deltaproteobacteria bacterium]
MIDDVSMIAAMNRTDPAKALKRACAEFESLFAYQLLKAMYETVPEGFMEEGLAGDVYRDMFSFEVARRIGETGALGIARVLEQTLRERFGYEDASSARGPEGKEADKTDMHRGEAKITAGGQT